MIKTVEAGVTVYEWQWWKLGFTFIYYPEEDHIYLLPSLALGDSNTIYINFWKYKFYIQPLSAVF
jgi:hypothetical protein